MITKHIAALSTKFNAFNPNARTCRKFLAQLPPNARQTIKITTKLLPRNTDEASELKLKFSDGKEMNFDVEKLGLADVMEEIDRHSRYLNRQADLKSS